MKKQDFLSSLSKPLEYWGTKTKEEVLVLLGPETAAMVGFDQRNPHHCYTLFEHCLHAVANLPATASLELKTAAFFHDIGKPVVATERLDGFLSFHGHAKASGVIAEPILVKLGFADEELRKILFFIVHHDDFINFQIVKDAKKWHIAITDDNVDRYTRKVLRENPWLTKRDLQELLRLCKADVSSQSEIVFMSGVFKESRLTKLARMRAIERYMFHEPEREY